MRSRHPLRLALIIGAMKSGTTNLFGMLGQHPQIACCRDKEPKFFSDETLYSKDLSYYHDLWDWRSTSHVVALEASTAYTKYPHIKHVPSRIAAAHDNARLIYIMRHPIERIESHIRQGLYQGFSQSLDAGLGERELACSRYAMQLDQYMQYFPRESLLLLTLEEYKAQPLEALRRICRHLQVDESFEFSEAHLNRHDGGIYQRRKTINRLLTIKGTRRLSLFCYRALSKLSRIALPSAARDVVKHRVLENDYGRFCLNDSEKQQVLEHLRADLKRLQTIYDVDVARYWQLPV